ncbi:MAG: glycosyltransferase family 4 protein [Vicinamibacterales bacterium]
MTPYDLSHDGGVNRHVVTLAAALGRLGHGVRVLGPASGATPAGCDGFPGVVAVPANGSRARVGLLVSKPAVRRYIQDGGFDLLHVHEPWVPGTARAAVQAADVPIVATFHTYAESESIFTRAFRRALSRPLAKVSCAIAVSDHAAAFARTVFDGRIHVVPNGIDSDFFVARQSPQPEDATGTSRPARLLFVGRFDEPRKGLRHFLAAAARLREAGHALDVRIVGHGDPEPFAPLANRAGARFIGRVDDEALVAMYGWCDVFCAPSTHGESFGVVLVEAMASGRPVVASDIPGYRTAAQGAAMLVPPGDEAALAASLARMIGDQCLRAQFVAHGWQRVHQLAWTRVVLTIAAHYEAATGERRAPRASVGAIA